MALEDKRPELHPNLVITDPPYPSLEKHRNPKAPNPRLVKKWFPVLSYENIGVVFDWIYRCLPNNSHFYCFSDWVSSRVLCDIAGGLGFVVWDPIVWDKVSIGMGYHYRRRYELILFFEKGKRKLRDLSIPNVLRFRVPRGRDVYPAEKPVELLEVLIRQSSGRGDMIMDPFCGSGATCVAAYNTGRKYVGYDILSGAVQIAENRINGKI
jgi:site-specific DNA-methyltransferase (adenine-specific)